MINIGDKQKSKILWGIFVLIVVVVVIDIIKGESSGYNSLSIIDFLIIFLPVALLLLHMTWTLGYIRGAIFILLASLTGLIFEIIGVKYGTIFGGHYIYQSQNFRLMFLDVPLLVPLYWTIFIYTGYTMVSSFLVWTNKNKPNRSQNNAVLLPLLIFLDGLVVVAIDIFMDPLLTHSGFWIWLNGGSYFGIPIGNFIGWFIVTIIVTGIFRTFEYFIPQKSTEVNKSILPVVCYGALCVSFIFYAINIQLPELALIGSLVMMPIVVINLIFFVNWKKKRDYTLIK